MTQITNDQIAEQLSRVLANSPEVPASKSVVSQSFCLDDLRLNPKMNAITDIAKLLLLLKGKKIKAVEWVQKWDFEMCGHVGSFHITLDE